MLISTIGDFIRSNIHKFYTSADVKKYVSNVHGPSKYPSWRTIRLWMTEEFGMTFRKVNLRYWEPWTKSNLIVKVKFLWVYCNFRINKIRMTFIDEFNISETTIKTYSWWVKGQSNYWFCPKNKNKINWIIAVTLTQAIHITTQTESVKAACFWNFIEGLVQKLEDTKESEDQEDVIIMDGASIHWAKIVKEKFHSLNKLAIVLPPYIPEWNPAELAINIIKSKLDRNIKNTG